MPADLDALAEELTQAMGGVAIFHGMTEEEWHAQQLQAHERDKAQGWPHDHDCAALVAASNWTGRMER